MVGAALTASSESEQLHLVVILSQKVLQFGMPWPPALCSLLLSKGQRRQDNTENLKQERIFQQPPALTLQHISQPTGRSKALRLPAILKGAFHLYSNSHSTPGFLNSLQKTLMLTLKR